MSIISQSKAVWQQVPAIADLTADANHIDVKEFEGEVDLRTFLAQTLSYYPWWIRTLYQVRWVFVRVLGMKQEGVPEHAKLKPEDIPMTPGKRASIFKIKAAEEDHFFVAGASDSHLTAHMAVIQEPIEEGQNRFHVVTIVHYHRWTGPVYFNVIRPFHHLVLNQMGKAGVAA
ncbi:MAG: DUF2867 domain-containing protein [Chloroflexota bacterium]